MLFQAKFRKDAFKIIALQKSWLGPCHFHYLLFYAVILRWLIAIAFWLSGGFIKSGLGNRIAYGIVSVFGKTTLGLTYSLVFAEALLAPAIPSVAARAGMHFSRCA